MTELREKFIEWFSPNVVVRVEVLSSEGKAQKVVYEEVRDFLRSRYSTVSDEVYNAVYVRVRKERRKDDIPS